MTGGDILGLGVVLVIVLWIVRALWLSYVVRRVRSAAVASEPSLDALNTAIIRFFERFPPADAQRLPLDPDEYPKPRPRKPSKPRARSTYRRRSYRRRRW